MDISIESKIDKSLLESTQTKEIFWRNSRENFFNIASKVKGAIQSGRKILICGNGGSACDALHFSGELVNRYIKDRAGIACLALTADAPLITCISNDFSFEDIFSRQVESLGQMGDVLIAISTSGNSPNIIKAIKAARKNGLFTLALLGGKGGKIFSEKLAESFLLVSGSNMTPRIQETHEWILHSLAEYLEN